MTERSSTGNDAAARPDRTVLPGGTIGILGGGQLGRMMVLAGRRMGYRFRTLDPTPDAPCGQVSDAQVVAAYDDLAAARSLAERCDVVTYEFENVNAEVARDLQASGHLPQGAELLRITQHRLREREALRTLDVPVAPFAAVQDRASLLAAVRHTGLPAVLKRAEGGYDGRGQWVVADEAALERAYAGAAPQGGTFVLERFVPFAKEVSVIAARRHGGQIETFPVTENLHRDGMLHLSVAPARVSEAVRAEADALARRIAARLEVVGTLAVEMFVTAEDRLWVNELAPRPHNSGHYSLDACLTCQFEQHLRAVCDLPLGSPRLLSPAAMVNLVGDDVAHLPALARRLAPEAKLHLYGKKEARPGRKMGHVTALGDSVAQCLEVLQGLPVPVDQGGHRNARGCEEVRP
ncbi:MAG: 5-(carboxyamino)imidazole ribonucleotide synthase [Jiangellaceae bacterium]